VQHVQISRCAAVLKRVMKTGETGAIRAYDAKKIFGICASDKGTSQDGGMTLGALCEAANRPERQYSWQSLFDAIAARLALRILRGDLAMA